MCTVKKQNLRKKQKILSPFCINPEKKQKQKQNNKKINGSSKTIS